ncbi:hypothetical protein DH86_00003879 [Scytalidium sp. 3C]|nr:hypothetical protein DH86_00003879 [Scytalidium sp. 3C]
MANDNAQAQELAVMPPAKAQDERVERVITEEEHRGISKGDHALMRSKVDDLSVWESLRRFKLVAGIAMIAAFSASLDGYQINLNGGIVANKGFIRQMANPGTTIIDGKYVSAWGGIQSTGQTVGQIVRNP